MEEQKSHSMALEETTIKFNQNKEQLEKIRPEFEALDQSKIQENDLKIILQMLGYSAEIKLLKERTENGSAKVKEVESKQTLTKEKIQELENRLGELKPKKLDNQLLLNAGNWFSTRKNILD